jgi:hypothetical protein
VLLLFNTVTGALEGQSGGPAVRISNNQSLVVKGQAFRPGQVALSIDSAAGIPITTVGADPSGAFSITITTERFTGGSHQIVATEGPLTASVAVTVDVIQ